MALTRLPPIYYDECPYCGWNSLEPQNSTKTESDKMNMNNSYNGAVFALAVVAVALIFIFAFVLVPLCGIAVLWFIEDVLNKDVDTTLYWTGISILTVYALLGAGLKNSKKKEDD